MRAQADACASELGLLYVLGYFSGMMFQNEKQVRFVSTVRPTRKDSQIRMYC